ncbi:MAG: hypothetical protein PUH03_03050 [bacterium]|nr:hypothetical protein [bacterium]MDY2830909.1 hypothetical protein [Alphaproteobacteria bacterium]
MKKVVAVAVVLAALIGTAEAQSSDNENIIRQFQSALASNNPQLISEHIQYPLKRPNPIPDIQDKAAFIDRYDTLFDKDLKQAILDSTPADWESIGSKGIMLFSGRIWLDYDGKLIALNLVSDAEQTYARQLSDQDKTQLYPSVQNFKKNIFIFETADFLGRIDQINDTQDFDYRLVLWQKGNNMGEKPYLIISQGMVEYTGSSGNMIYHFPFENMQYNFEVTLVGGDEIIPYALTILKGGQTVSFAEAKILRP